MDNINKLDMESEDIVDENIKKIQELFPDCVTETEDGLKIDYEQLKQELSKDIVDDKKERYELTWPGKKEAILEANTSTTKTLRPIREKSINFDNTKNIYIEGDNLEALKILQESYLGKVKCIYIDPPYNTGNDFIYKDNFKKDVIEEGQDSGELDEKENRLVANQQSNGRFHSDWLSMMYPRLKLAKNLLTDDGVIFVSIDACELNNLKKILDEIFGENNKISIVTCKVKAPSGVASNAQMIFDVSEYLLIYAKNKSKFEYNNLKEDVEIVQNGTKTAQNYNMILKKINLDNMEYVTSFGEDKLFKVPKKDYEICSIKEKNAEEYFENYDNIFRTAALSGGREKIVKNFLSNNSDDDLYVFQHIPQKGKNSNVLVNDLIYKNAGILFLKDFAIKDENKKLIIKQQHITNIFNNDWWEGIAGEGNVPFKNGKKPLKFLKRLLSFIKDDNYTVLDFFSGSASTAHAVMQLNAENNGKRKYIMIQIPENCENNIDTEKEKFKTICEIGEERIRRSSKKIKDETNADIDYGFRVYKIDSSNMKDIYYEPNRLEQNFLDQYESNVKDDRTPEDLLTQIILDLGLTLDLNVEVKQILNNKIYYVGGNSLVACLDKKIDINIIPTICKCKPEKIVFRENGFDNDSDKINAFEKINELLQDSKDKIYVL